jgi:hypothetical protein
MVYKKAAQMSAALYKIKHLSLKLPTRLADGLESKGTLLFNEIHPYKLGPPFVSFMNRLGDIQYDVN